MDAAFLTEIVWVPILLALIGAFFTGWQLRTKTQATSRDTRVRERGAADRQEAAARAQLDLAERNHERQLLLAELQSTLGTRSAIEVEAERITLRSDEERRAFAAEQLRLWAEPILLACGDLRGRLWSILRKGGHNWLKEGHDPQKRSSMTSEHFRDSTAYVFCQYFCFVELLSERLGYIFETRGEAREAFVETLRTASSALGSHEWTGRVETEGDSQIFHWQQRALGEIVTVQDAAGRARCMGFAAFLTAKQAENFGPHLTPLYALIDGLDPDSPRWPRLQQFRAALDEVEIACRGLVGLSKDLHNPTKPEKRGPAFPPARKRSISAEKQKAKPPGGTK